MEKVNNKHYTFKEYLITKPEAKFYFVIAIVFAYFRADDYYTFFLQLILMSLIALGLAFFDYKVFRRKTIKGEIIEMLGCELTQKNTPILFKLAQEDKTKLKEQIQKYAELQCGGNISLAIDLLEQDENERASISKMSTVK